LNEVLRVYDMANRGVFIFKEIEKKDLIIDYQTVLICNNQLEADGYIQLFNGYSQSPFGTITAKGKIFIQEGGYKDDKTKVDRLVLWTKNNTIFAVLIIVCTGLSALFGLITIVLNLIQSLK
jgi:hypothetical protein